METKIGEIDKKVVSMKLDDKSKQELAAAKKKIDKNMDELAQATQATLEHIVESNQRVARCKIGLEKLEPHVRIAVVLRYQEGFSYEQMAQICHEKPATLQARVARAMPLLRRCLENKGVELR